MLDATCAIRPIPGASYVPRATIRWIPDAHDVDVDAAAVVVVCPRLPSTKRMPMIPMRCRMVLGTDASCPSNMMDFDFLPPSLDGIDMITQQRFEEQPND
jgi:hypothetical protein